MMHNIFLDHIQKSGAIAILVCACMHIGRIVLAILHHLLICKYLCYKLFPPLISGGMLREKKQ